MSATRYRHLPIGQELRIFNHLTDALTQAADAAHLLGFRLEVPVELALLGVPDTTGLRQGNDLERPASTWRSPPVP